jgi:hypothetical protein
MGCMRGWCARRRSWREFWTASRAYLLIPRFRSTKGRGVETRLTWPWGQESILGYPTLQTLRICRSLEVFERFAKKLDVLSANPHPHAIFVVRQRRTHREAVLPDDFSASLNRPPAVHFNLQCQASRDQCRRVRQRRLRRLLSRYALLPVPGPALGCRALRRYHASPCSPRCCTGLTTASAAGYSRCPGRAGLAVDKEKQRRPRDVLRPTDRGRSGAIARTETDPRHQTSIASLRRRCRVPT